MKTPSLERLPTKAKEDASPHEMRLSPAGHQPSIFWLREYFYYYIIYYCYYYYYILFIIIIPPTVHTTKN